VCLLNSKREGRDGGGKNEGQKFGVSVVVCVAWAEGKERVNGQREGRMEKEKEERRKEGRKGREAPCAFAWSDRFQSLHRLVLCWSWAGEQWLQEYSAPFRN